MEGPPVKAVPEKVRDGSMLQRALFKAVPKRARNRAPSAPEGTLSQAKGNWPRPPPVLEEGPQCWQIGVDVNPPWPWIARTHSHQDNEELGHFLISLGDETISIMSCAENEALQ